MGAARERRLIRDGGGWLTAVQLLVLLEVLLEVEGLAAAGLRAGEGLLVDVLVLLVVLQYGGKKRIGVKIATPKIPRQEPTLGGSPGASSNYNIHLFGPKQKVGLGAIPWAEQAGGKNSIS